MDLSEACQIGLDLLPQACGKGPPSELDRLKRRFGEPLQNIINAYAYGDVWSRPALPMATKSLAMIAMMAAVGRPNELRVHVKGALTNGCTAEQIQEILLLVAMYGGIPLANEAHRVAVDVLRESGAT